MLRLGPCRVVSYEHNFLLGYKIVAGKSFACGSHTASNGLSESGCSSLRLVASPETSLTCGLYIQLSRAKQVQASDTCGPFDASCKQAFFSLVRPNNFGVSRLR